MEDINLMREFVRLVECRNFSQVARELYVSQPTVTKHVQRLEQEFGCVLVLRDTRSVNITEEGRLVCDAFSDILTRFEALEATLEERRRGVTGSLRLGVLYHGIAELALPVAAEYARRYPGVRIEFVSGQNDDMVSGLADGSLDAAIVDLKPDAERFRLEELRRYPLMCAVSEGSDLARLESVGPEDVRGHIAKVLVAEYGDPRSLLRDYDSCSVEAVANVDAMALALSDPLSFSPLGSILDGKLGPGMRFVPFEVPVGQDVFCLACRPDEASASVALLMEVASDLRL